MTKQVLPSAPDVLADTMRSLAERAGRSKTDRRRFLAGLAALGLLPAAAAAQEAKQVVLANWGGDSIRHFQSIFGDPFTRDTGTRVLIDGSGPSAGRIRAMVEAGRVTWDVCDSSVANSVILGRQGLVQRIDYSRVDRNAVFPEFAYEFCVAAYLFSNVLTWDTGRFSGRAPQGWADFWNVRDFPGKRTMRRDLQGAFEIALLADGVPMDRLYPLDEKRALAKLRELKPHVIFWTTAAESQTLLREGEATMGCLWSTRAAQLGRDTRGRVRFTLNQGQIIPGVWVVPSANPGGSLAFDFIRSMQDPERQAALFRAWDLAPANPAGGALVPEDMAEVNLASAANRSRQFPIDAQWYIDHQERLQPIFLDLISS
ncbi:ABC transporter substrate-binding protein [Roseomonas sp. OT10]|uniref:ABC transporter substrate-binding protein n=1 Tax=Roseomonas cutis TaxID=2897332 RepID=UPI001E4212C8|nr:ABC transporter substrate-binding protein [Roseomonas sp. OT10]UFN48517.1 ABC transporter substrate-binding protein [Roseomonas sp. OT10]